MHRDEDKGSSLPPERAFVVQLRGGRDFENQELAGRVEHVTSGAASRFKSIGELKAFIIQVIRRLSRAPS